MPKKRKKGKYNYFNFPLVPQHIEFFHHSPFHLNIKTSQIKNSGLAAH